MKFVNNNKSRNLIEWFLVIFLLLYIGVAIVLLCVILLDGWRDNVPYSFMIVMLLFCLIVTIFAMDLISWQIIGAECITADDRGIEIVHTGRIFKKRLLITYEDIKSIENCSNQKDVFRYFWFPTRQGSIKISYGHGSVVNIGRNLSYGESESLLSKLRDVRFDLNIVSSRKSTHNWTRTEVLFLFWLIFSFFIAIPLGLYFDKMREVQSHKDGERLMWLKSNYTTKYCYSDVGRYTCACADILEYADSIYIDLYYRQCEITDSMAYERKDTTYGINKIIPDFYNKRYNFRGVVYVAYSLDSVSLVYSNFDLYEPFYVHNKYLHDSLPKCEPSVYLDYLKDEESRKKNRLLWSR